MVSGGLQSALIVAIPEAEAVVAQHRSRLDGSAVLGIPAHVTVLFPFVAPGEINGAVHERLASLFATVSRFGVVLDHTDWFGDRVLWLGPRDPGPFRALTMLVADAFPGYPPFEGEFEDVVPHLTVGHGQSMDELRAAEDSVRAHLPIPAQVAAVTLMSQQPDTGLWAKTATYDLG
jgi:2'-5' RNA ligase